MQTPIKIEKGIPCPPGKYSLRRYPVDQLEIGDSFTVPEAEGRTIRSVLGPYKESHPGWNYSSRKVVNPDGSKCVRVWRVS